LFFSTVFNADPQFYFPGVRFFFFCTKIIVLFFVVREVLDPPPFRPCLEPRLGRSVRAFPQPKAIESVPFLLRLPDPLPVLVFFYFLFWLRFESFELVKVMLFFSAPPGVVISIFWEYVFRNFLVPRAASFPLPSLHFGAWVMLHVPTFIWG